MQTNEIPFKTWCHDEATREGVTPGAIRSRVTRATTKTYDIRLRRVNSRVIFVVIPKLKPTSEKTDNTK